MKGHMRHYWDNKSANNIVHNPLQYECIQQCEVDKNFAKNKLNSALNVFRNHNNK